MGKTPQLLVTACLGYFVAVACSGGAGTPGASGMGNAGAAGALGASGDAGAGLGVEVPDAAAAGAAGGCGCEPKEPTVVTVTCHQGPSFYVECVAEFPGKTAQELAGVRVLLSITGCQNLDTCDQTRQQNFTAWQQVTHVSPVLVGYQDSKVTASGPAGVTSATFVLP